MQVTRSATAGRSNGRSSSATPTGSISLSSAACGRWAADRACAGHSTHRGSGFSAAPLGGDVRPIDAQWSDPEQSVR